MTNERGYSRLAWPVCALTMALTACLVALSVANGSRLEDLTFSIVVVSISVVGGLISSRQPSSVVGWLFLGSAFCFAAYAFAGEYVVYGSLPLARTMAVVSASTEGVGAVLIFILLPLYFPNGRLVSPRWRPVAWFTIGSTLATIALFAVSPGEAVRGTGIPNPLGVEALRPYADIYNPVLFVVYIAEIFAAAASLVVRFRRSVGEERQQIKWFTFAASFIPVWFVTNQPVEDAFPNLFSMMDALVIAGVPVAAGIAILKHRLYDIDVVINKTLVYGALTASLVGVYLGSVVSLQYVFGSLAGGDSQLAIVASTLVIAALFVPLRRRIQNFIDRRFYRNKYDAAKTLEAFSAKARNETS